MLNRDTTSYFGFPDSLTREGLHALVDALPRVLGVSTLSARIAAPGIWDLEESGPMRIEHWFLVLVTEGDSPRVPWERVRDYFVAQGATFFVALGANNRGAPAEGTRSYDRQEFFALYSPGAETVELASQSYLLAGDLEWLTRPPEQAGYTVPELLALEDAMEIEILEHFAGAVAVALRQLLPDFHTHQEWILHDRTHVHSEVRVLTGAQIEPAAEQVATTNWMGESELALLQGLRKRSQESLDKGPAPGFVEPESETHEEEVRAPSAAQLGGDRMHCVRFLYRLDGHGQPGEQFQSKEWFFSVPAERDEPDSWVELLNRVFYDANVALRRRAPGDPNWLALESFEVVPVDFDAFLVTWDGVATLEAAKRHLPWVLAERAIVWEHVACYIVDGRGAYDGMGANGFSELIAYRAHREGRLDDAGLLRLLTYLYPSSGQAFFEDRANRFANVDIVRPWPQNLFQSAPGSRPGRSGPPETGDVNAR